MVTLLQLQCQCVSHMAWRCLVPSISAAQDGRTCLRTGLPLNGVTPREDAQPANANMSLHAVVLGCGGVARCCSCATSIEVSTLKVHQAGSRLPHACSGCLSCVRWLVTQMSLPECCGLLVQENFARHMHCQHGRIAGTGRIAGACDS
jgi:hypothetical protein